MNNKELIAELASRTGLSQLTTRKMAMTVVDNLLTRVQNEGAVQVPTFGTFELKKRLERIATIPGSGKRMLIPPRLSISFRPVTALKERLQKGETADE
ncbi:MAG: HU family DNA-binding protein [Prevotella sp.]|nr:HU family DNA-binding protein [Prevotella sp.]